MTQRPSASGMKLGIVLQTMESGLEGQPPTFQAIQELALAAERAGLDSIWLPDHLLRSPRGEVFWEVFTLLGALAAVTTRITLGTLVVSTSFRPPALVAKIAATLDAISGGRLILGLGAGWYQPEYEAFGYPFDHLASRFEEALKIIAPLLREGQVDFQGQYYQVHNCVLRPRGPSRHGPPLMIAGRRPRMLQLAARYADAWNNAWHPDPSTMNTSYAAFKQACALVGRDPATVELTLGTGGKATFRPGSRPRRRRRFRARRKPSPAAWPLCRGGGHPCDRPVGAADAGEHRGVRSHCRSSPPARLRGYPRSGYRERARITMGRCEEEAPHPFPEAKHMFRWIRSV